MYSSKKQIKLILIAVVVGAVLLTGTSQGLAAVTIETVPVGNAGNAADTTGFGSVPYTYNIGKYEVTAGQYTAFLNAVAQTDTYSLYNTNQADTNFGSGITRSGSSGSYAYSVDAAFVSRPVNYVSFWDATRFANWLHNGQPVGVQDNSTTEDGAYTLTTEGISGNTITRNTGASWAVTSEDEWYKAAYYSPADSSYYLYPTSSNTAPGRDLLDTSANNANHYGVPVPIQSPYFTTVVGEFQNSASPYNTFDQGGNVLEWNEAIILTSDRGLRGGWFSSGDFALQSGSRTFSTPTGEADFIGFRVSQIPDSQVPEPTSVGLLGLGIIGILLRRRGATK